MKGFACWLLAAALLLSCAGCGGAPAQSEPAQGMKNDAPMQASAPAQEAAAPEKAQPEVSASDGTPEKAQPEASAQEAAAPEETRAEVPARPEEVRSVLVVYFSATGTTRGVAERIAALTGGDLAEIVPARPYTAGDLDYSDRTTRATAEQNDPDARPEIANDVSLEGCTTLYLGYPIWWGQAPRILSTFVESHDFTGITVIPFCTSGSSDIGRSGDTLAEQAGSGRWLQGRRFAGSVSDEALREWLDETGGTDMEKTLKLVIGDTRVSVAWEDNESVEALKELVKDGPLTVRMSMYGGFEQVGPLGTSLVRNDVQTVTSAGDIVLYAGSQIVVFYGSNSWAYTRLGRIADKSAAELKELLGNGDVVLTLSLE